MRTAGGFRGGGAAPTRAGAAAAIVADHFTRSVTAAELFFAGHTDAVADACLRMARRFEAGGKLVVFGTGAQGTDAQHVSVEFVHPVIVGKRALPAIALTSDAAVLTGYRLRPCEPNERIHATAAPDLFVGPLQALARDADIAMGLVAGTDDGAVMTALGSARERGMFTVLLCSGTAPPPGGADVAFAVDADDPLIVQEVHETLYHVFWELVHLFFEHGVGVESSGPSRPASGADYERELYPFLFGAAAGNDGVDAALHDARISTLRKCRDICELRQALLAASGAAVAAAGAAAAARFDAGGKLLAFGNGGSATDAQDAAVDCMAPPVPGWRRVPALALTNDVGILTAIGNDVGFDHVFARQVVAFGGADDVAVGFTTSGTSRNVIAALAEARRRGLMTVGFSGRDGGELARSGVADYLFTSVCDYVPRVQEAHATAWHALLAVAQAELEATGRVA